MMNSFQTPEKEKCRKYSNEKKLENASIDTNI